MWNYQKCNNSTFIQRLKRKKEDALEYVIEQYLSLVKGVVLKTLPYQKNFGIVEECINDVFLAVWNNADQFVGNEEDFQRWIAVIAKYKATDQLRKLIRNREDCAAYAVTREYFYFRRRRAIFKLCLYFKRNRSKHIYYEILTWF
ncbi:sigma factor [Neobacillus niacini]|uniref:sigma factor n=1 Tax=Neobacillus niacini TaxID=86668 RepID=UPI00286089C1|nr:sigma factor [Neobacillus niacini]MDR6999032.1 DNA-directed RNA polymerase specialized sigma24 family protein [Neobacillus niacini]